MSPAPKITSLDVIFEYFLQNFSFICLLSYDVYIKKMIIESVIDNINSQNSKTNKKENSKKESSKKDTV